MGLRRRHFWIVGALALLAAMLVVTLSMSEAPIPSQRLPDGTVVSIAKVSYGRVHRFTAGNFWERFAARVLPARLRSRIGLRERLFAITNSTESTVIFVQSFRSNGTFSAAPAMHSWFSTSGMLRDDVGNELSLSGRYVSLLYSNVLVEAFPAPLVSHLATQLQIDLKHSDWNAGPKGSTHFTLPNPAPHSAPRWSAPPLPQTNAAGDLRVELLELSTRGGPASNQLSVLPADFMPRTSARIRLLQNGAPTESWRVEAVTVFDEESNAFGVYLASARSSNALEFGAGLSPREPRKFRFELARVPPFAPDETATVTNILVPTSPDSMSYGQLASPITMDFQGFKLQVTRLAQMNDFQQLSLEYRVSHLGASGIISS
jgi:hypothetical protein